jgi:biofilm PGA synthesis N-glycosyltransferase PgaC
MILTVITALCLLLVSYTWLGYGLFLLVLSRFQQVRIQRSEYIPRVSIIVAARNEEKQIEERINNLLALQYPKDHLEIIVGSDGSTDRTSAIVRAFTDERIRLFEFAESRGRAAVHNETVARAGGDIVVFTDAATRFDARFLQQIMQNFADPRVGCVSGSITFGNHAASEISESRGLYWRYEYWLRDLESRSGVFGCASGPCMAVRRQFFKPLEKPSYDVDFMTPLDVITAGFLVLQDERAVAYDEMFSTPRQELRAQIRMVSRNLAGYLDRYCLLGQPRNLLCAWGLISHKVLRWATPFFLLIVFLATGILAVRGRMTVLWAAQILFYGSAVAGWIWNRFGQSARIFSFPFSFCVANIGFLLGTIKSFRGKRIVVY